MLLKNLNLEENAIWKQRFRAPSIVWAMIANLNRERGLLCSDRDGVLQLYAWNVADNGLRQLTTQPTGVVSGLLSADGEYVYYLQDDSGNEIGHFVRVPFSGGPPEDVTPDLPPYGSFQISQNFRGTMLGARVTDPSGQMLYLFAPNQTPRQIYKSQSQFVGPSFSHDGDIAVVGSSEGTGSLDMRLLAFDVASGEQVAELWDGSGVGHSLGDFSPLAGDSRMLSSSSASGYARPLIWNPRTGERHDLLIDEIPGEVTGLQWSRDAQRVLLSQFDQAQHHHYLYNLETDTALKVHHPDGFVATYPQVGCFTEDDRILATWQDASHPARLIAMDGTTGEYLGPILAVGDVPAGHAWQSVTFPSENGSTIHGWLAVPTGSGPFPTILDTHGGPTAVMSQYYAPGSQAWLDHGFAYLTINYHGSTTFGKAFEKSILGQLGELEVQDMAAAHRWLVESRIAQPDAVFLTGESYGGYLTLLGLGRRPELWAGGMAEVAIADWSTMYEDESESLRGYQRILFGGTPEETPEAHRKSSPITYAEEIQAPILVIQGQNDTRCPPRQMRNYEARLKSLGKKIDIHWFDAGHGSLAQEQRIEHQELMLRFAHRVLK